MLKNDLFFLDSKWVGTKNSKLKKLFFVLSFLLFCIPTTLKAEELVAPAENDPQTTIYISGSASISGTDEITIVHVVKAETAQQKATSKPEKINFAAEIKHAEIAKKEHVAKIVKQAVPKQNIASAPADQSIGAGHALGNQTCTIPVASYFGKLMIAHQYTVLSIPVFAYLQNRYTADFSKTATLSQFLFSRPPPVVLG